MGKTPDLTIPDGYKQTDVGVVPEDWEVKKLGDLSTFRTGPFGSALHKSDYTLDGVPVINPMHINDGRITPTHTMTITNSAAKQLSEFLLRAGDIIIGRRGDMGRCAVVEKAQAGWLCGTGSLIIRPNREANADFLQRILSSPQAIGCIEDASVGSTMINLNQNVLQRLNIQTPPLPEQQAIAEVLSDVDALITSLDKLIIKKRNIKQGAMQILLTGKNRLAGFSGEWETKTLGEIALFINGRAYHISEWEFSGVPVIRLQNLTGGDQYYYSNLNLPQKQYCNHGDLLFMWSATFGVHIWKGQKAIYHYHIWKIECKPSFIEKDFLYFKLGELTQELKQTSTNGGTMLHVTKEIMEATKILLPPTIEEQKAIAQILSDMDVEIEALEKKREKYKAIKQGMMQELLTGKTRLIDN